jgi:hypothetical protein
MDHQPLIWLIRATQDYRGLQINERWLTALSTFNIDWRHLPGSLNVEADALSRPLFVRPSVDARQNRAALMYDDAFVSTDASNVVTIPEATANDTFYAAALRVAQGSDPKSWLADNPHAAHLPILHSIKDRLYIHQGDSYCGERWVMMM